MRRRLFLGCAAAATGALLLRPAGAAQESQVDVDDELPDAPAPREWRLRVRVTTLSPPEIHALRFRAGGEGLGGEVKRGELRTPQGTVPSLGEWTEWATAQDLVARSAAGWQVTFAAGRPEKKRSSSAQGLTCSVEAHFEIQLDAAGKQQRASVPGPRGGTATIVIGPREHGPALQTLDDIARARLLKIGPPAPALRDLVMITDVGGFDVGHGYGIRSTDPAVASKELESVQRLGVNALRSQPDLGPGATLRPPLEAFKRADILGPTGFPLVRPGPRTSRAKACPFSDEVALATREQVDRFLSLSDQSNAREVWLLTVDEIGSAFGKTAERRPHVALCTVCAAAFRAWLAPRGLTPADLGARAWDDVTPLNLWTGGPWPDWERYPHLARLASLTQEFVNYASARLFTPLRDACAARNARLDSGAAAGPRVYSYSLRGNTFLREPHALDFFEFYRHADNAVVYETSSREPRLWGWDSYLCDVLRSVAARHHLAIGVYVKPHRGAPLQRALTAVARGARMLYWYTYGPDYKKGDSFSTRALHLAGTRKAADVLRRTEERLVGGAWPAHPEVAILKSESTERWTRLLERPEASVQTKEDSKWTYSALRHSGVLVDALDESHCAADELGPYGILYAFGSHLSVAAARGIAKWVSRGGTLVVSAGSLRWDEMGAPLKTLNAILGVDRREDLVLPNPVPASGAVALPPLPEEVTSRRTRSTTVTWDTDGAVLPVGVGHERLHPSRGSRVLARFEGGDVAVTEARHGAGSVLLSGFFPGLEYALGLYRADWDMRRDLSPEWRKIAASPAATRPRPVVVSDPLVEAVPVRKGSRDAIVLCNWGYRKSPDGDSATLLRVESLQIDVGLGRRYVGVTRALGGAEIPLVSTAGARQSATIQGLDEGDVLLFDA